jgi:plastocyanin
MKTWGWGGAVGLSLAVAVSGCSDDRTATVVKRADDGTTRVEALDNSFRSVRQQIEAGGDVLFVNLGRNVHNIVPSAGSSEWGVEQERFGPGGSYRVRFVEPGIYPYYCTIHGNETTGMVGEIEVLP